MRWPQMAIPSSRLSHRFRAHVDEQWTSLQGVHGGVVAAIAVNASSTVLRDEGTDSAMQLRAATFGYVAGSAGPDAADRLLARDGCAWLPIKARHPHSGRGA